MARNKPILEYGRGHRPDTFEAKRDAIDKALVVVAMVVLFCWLVAIALVLAGH